jgi:hypothetical protein
MAFIVWRNEKKIRDCYHWLWTVKLQLLNDWQDKIEWIKGLKAIWLHVQKRDEELLSKIIIGCATVCWEA